MKRHSHRKILRVLCAYLGMVGTLQATEIVYDSSGPVLAAYYSDGEIIEFGDEIELGGRSRVLTDFIFEYFGDFTSQLDERAQVRLYKNDLPGGPFPAPGTLLYSSDLFQILPGYQTNLISGLSVTLPDVLTWTVQFYGMSGAPRDRAGLITHAPPPLVGDSFLDFWGRNSAGWDGYLLTPEGNFGARVVAVPEPGTAALGAIAAAVFWLAQRCRCRWGGA